MGDNDFLKQCAAKYPECDTDISFINKLAVVRFETDNRGNVSGKCSFGLVYRHRECEDSIKAGETWVCELTENFKTYSSYRQFFAKGLMKVDASFIFDLKQENMQILADTMWNDHRGYFDSMFDERYSEIVEQKAQERAAELAAETITQVQQLQSEIESLKEKNMGLVTELADRDSYIERMRSQRIQSTSGDVHHPVRRLTPDTLYSDGFDGKYEVCFSADRKKMLIIPDEKGSIESVDRTIVLSELNDVMPFIMSETLISDCGKDGRLTVSLV